MPGKVWDKSIENLQDSGCDVVIVKIELVDEANFTRVVGYMLIVSRTTKKRYH